MSISFTMKVTEVTKYSDYDDKEVVIEEQVATLELGNARILRDICPKNSKGYIEDCGCAVIDGFQALSWLSNKDRLHIKAAYRYIHALMSGHCNDSEDKVSLRIAVTWG